MEERVERHVLLRLIKALNEEEELQTIAQIISADPVLTAKVLKFVNSAYFNLRRTISSVEDAIAYLGYKKLKEVAFAVLVSSLLTEKSKEEIEGVLTFAYLMKLTAKRHLPELSEEAFMVGVLYPVYTESPEEVVKILKEAGVSKTVIEGLTEEKSPLGILRNFALKLLPYCIKLNRGEIEDIPVKTTKFKKTFLTKVCLDATYEAEKIVKLL
ncbi:HDOD domain-containing protein [Thermovibrio sp.]